jgi:hypothetical protein
MKLFDNDDQWTAFLYGTIIGLFAGIGIVSVIISYLLYI